MFLKCRQKLFGNGTILLWVYLGESKEKGAITRITEIKADDEIALTETWRCKRETTIFLTQFTDRALPLQPRGFCEIIQLRIQPSD